MGPLAAVALALAGALALAARAGGAGGDVPRTRYSFYRSAGGEAGVGGRRMFGGEMASLEEFPAVCALTDRYYNTRCSGSVLAPRWALTAAHCVSPRVTYVKYNTAALIASTGSVATVMFLYRHPMYHVEQQDEGSGMDVTQLHNDVGLVRTKEDMRLRAWPERAPLAGLRRYDPVELHGRQVRVLGFGRTEDGSRGERLFGVALQLVFCERGGWFHCVCGVTAGAPEDGRGVCTGDSGGPVVLDGLQVGVTSMGPTECGMPRASMPHPAAASVFTALYHYVGLLNDTMQNADTALHMTALTPDAAAPPDTTALLMPSLLLVCRLL